MLIKHLQVEAKKLLDAEVTKEYATKYIPKVIAENGYSVDPEHFLQYQKQYL